MCVVSMVMDHQWDHWRRKYWPQPTPFIPWPQDTGPMPMPGPPLPPLPITPPSQEEIEEFRRLLERAREYDQRNAEPDCEMETKKKLLKQMADSLGVNIDFIDAPASQADGGAHGA